MRILSSLAAAAAALVFAGAAAADPVRIAPVALSPEFQQQLADDYGEREGEVLQGYVESQLASALADAGAEIADSGVITVEAVLIDADPTKPTFAQLSRNLGLSYALSLSAGGAELSAVLRGADGRVLAEVSHKRYAWGLEDASLAAGSWGDARRSIRQFASKVARAYRSQLSSVEVDPA